MLGGERINRDWLIQLILLGLTVLFSLVYFLSNMGSDLISAGEARAAEIAREMLERGNFVLPSLNHEVSAETMTKPPLYHWMLIVTGAPFDWQNWSVRITSVLSAFGSIWMVFLLGRQMFGLRAAVFSALVLSTSILFLENSSAARMDGFFSFLILSSVYCFWMAINDDRYTRWLYGFYALSALAVLTKGPVGALFPAVVALILLLSSPNRQDWRTYVPIKGVLLFLALALSWYVLLVITGPPGLVSNFLFGQLTQWWEGSSNAVAKGGQPITYYLPHILIGVFPWSLFLPAALFIGISAARKDGGAGIKSMLIWFVGGFILFSLGGKKAARYLLPLMPPFALVMGFYWDKVGEAISGRHSRVLIISSVAALLLATVLALLIAGVYTDTDWVVQWLYKGRNRGGASQLTAVLDLLLQYPVQVAVVVIVVIISASLAVFGSVKRNRYLLVFGLAVMIWGLVWPFAVSIRPVLKQQLSPRVAAETIADMVPKDAVIYGGGSGYEHAVRWYLQRDIQLEPREKLYDRILQQPSSWVLLTENGPLNDKLLSTDRKRVQWHIDYYYMTLFPGSATNSKITR